MFPNNTSNTKILGLDWNKASDTMFVIISTYQQKAIAQQNILSYVALIYDPLGFTLRSHVIGKAIYRELCDEKVPWDAEVFVRLNRKVEKWVRDINSVETELPRSTPLAQDSVPAIDLRVFADASIVANCAAVYAVMYQHNSVNQGLVTSKPRISKHNITIPRLELISTHMGANLAHNVKSALESQNMRSVTGWTHSTVVLYWLNKKGNYKQFVGNRLNQIREKEFVNWCFVSTKENPADIAIKGSLIKNIWQVW